MRVFNLGKARVRFAAGARLGRPCSLVVKFSLRERPREFFGCVVVVGFRYGVVGNMSGSHPVASGSIPGIGLACAFFCGGCWVVRSW